ncbi:MAG: T9SS type A sorting domain-containing protein, partial [Ignavibacteria bacterium]
PSTSIRFDIRNSDRVTLKVYNTTGQEVASLINNEIVSAGTKEVTFEGSNLNSGIYFYTLTVGDFKETKKMMLIK